MDDEFDGRGRMLKVPVRKRVGTTHTLFSERHGLDKVRASSQWLFIMMQLINVIIAIVALLTPGNHAPAILASGLFCLVLACVGER